MVRIQFFPWNIWKLTRNKEKKGQKVDAGLLISYFARQEEARKALQLLEKRGFRRAALAYKSADGEVHTRDPFIWRRAVGVIIIALLCGGLAGVASLVLNGTPSTLTLILAGGSAGTILGMVWIRRSKQGIERKLIENHARWLVSEETVLVLQAPIETLRAPASLLRQTFEVPPAIFVLHPDRSSFGGDSRGTTVPLSLPLVREHAQRLAREHRADPKPVKNTRLLEQIVQARRRIHQVCSDLSEASRLELTATPAAEWILDNEYIIEGNVRDIQQNLPRRYYQLLPGLAGEQYRGLPRIYDLAKELISHTDLRLDRENILAFFESYQSERTLTIGELWATPQILRVSLIENIQTLAARALADLREREIADFWANRLATANRRDPNRLFTILAELTENQLNPSAYFGTQLVGHLHDEAAALVLVQGWLERTLRKSLNDLSLREQNRQTKDQISIANAFTSLRQLALLDWRKIFEKLSRVDQLLRRDPSGVYPGMDFDTRDRFRGAVEEFARRSGEAEEQVAQRAVDMAAGAASESAEDERRIHIGTYLIGEASREFARLLGCADRRFRVRQWIYRHRLAMYFVGLSFFTVAFISLVASFGLGEQSPGIQLFMAFLFVIPTSQLAIEVVNYLVTRVLSPHTLPKMDFEASGIPDAFRTLVVVPTMLVDAESIRTEVERLEIRYLANKESNLLFSLFTDYTDADHAICEGDERLLQTAIAGLESLNGRYDVERFFLFHRKRRWSESEQKFIGWERKRGKLEELNRLIDGTRPEDAGRLVFVGEAGRLSNVRFVITLDSDTQLPHGTARRMIETLAHPLNQPRFNADGTIAAGSYTIIQPRVSPTLPSTSASLFSSLFADAIGIDPYTKAVSDVNQDLTGEGSYHGKGIYDVRTFSRVLSRRFPEERILSHDLIEGAYIRVGLASDIELFDEFPQGYRSYSRREHRWIRGDWQIADWIFPRIPRPGGGKEANPLSRFNRWKIFDNLRRSLLPVTSLGLLIASWLVSPQLGWIATLVVAVQFFFHPFAQPLTMATTHKGLKNFTLPKVMHDLLRALADAALLPHQAELAMDAIVRVWFRRLISHHKLLEWTPARVIHWSAARLHPMFAASLGLASILSVMVGWAVYLSMPSALAVASPWLVLWFFSPLVGLFLNLRRHPGRKQLQLARHDVRFLRGITRRTWRFFSDFVGDQTSWLPPDNYQVAHQNRLAMRTSPTNIGLWMNSALAANDFGYLTPDQVVETLTHSMETIGRLDRYEGHLLNWYDIKTLTPLEPRYVSSVDSGNLLGSLWALEHGIDEMILGPVLDRRTFEGLLDTGEVLRDVVEQKGSAGVDASVLDEIIRMCESPPDGIIDMIHLLRRVEGSVRNLIAPSRESGDVDAGARYWAGQMAKQASAWLGITDRYLSWIEILAEKKETDLSQLGPDALLAFHDGLHRAPSLHDLANGHGRCIRVLRSVRETYPSHPDPLSEWLDRLLHAFAESQWLAGEVLGMSEGLITSVRELSDSINMSFLYDPERRLFSIGYNVSEGHPDSAYYDLLASEARFGSFVAIARGDIPIEHWFSMSRRYGAIGRHRVLLSWTGTMFEYLMPMIFQRSYGNSLLDKAVREAVSTQIEYGRRRRVPWGISESAFGDLDINRTYQYKAFGVPELGLKRGLEEDVVVAPYAALLTVSVEPDETIANLRRLAGLGLLNEYGFYEAIDFSRQPTRKGERGVIVEAYMAHHQGMGLLSLTNFLHGNAIQRRFHADLRVRAVEPLLHERVPILPPLYHISTREGVPAVMSAGELAPSVSRFDTPHTATPKTQILSNGRYGLMVTNAGGGYSQWREYEITRWRSDPTQDLWGTFCYIREADADRLWSNTFHPVGGRDEVHSVEFALDRAVFRHVDNGIHTETEVIVSSEDDVEIRRISLVNRTVRTRRLDLTSYVELSMAAHNADRQHPAFNKMFIQTELVSELQALLAYRRARSRDEPPIYVAHRITVEQAEDELLQFETDRRRFIGRGRTLVKPMGVFQEPGNTQGFVLDPILSLRRSVTLGPGQRVRVSLVLAAADTRQQVLGLMGKYSDPHAIDRAMDFAWASAQLELRLLRIQPDDARRFQQIASNLIFPYSLLRSPAKRIEENRKGQSGLWAYGISGDFPIVLVTIGEARDISLVRQTLEAHSYWRRHGLKVDLVILNEEASVYEQPLREQLERLIQTHSMVTGSDRPGGVFLRSVDHIPEEDITLLRAVASVALTAARGTLPKQMGVPVEVPELPKPLARKRFQREPSAPLPFMTLHYFNSLGGFTADGHEYVIYLGPNTHTPAPWVNVIANPTFGTMVSESGSGFTWYGNSQRNRLTQWSNDPVLDPPSEALYIRDEETGVYWTPTSLPIREDTAYRARHGAGYTVFEHNSHGIDQELTVFVPVDEKGGEPVKLQRLWLNNDSSRHRKLSVTYYVEWTLGENRESSQMHVVTHWDDEVQALLARNRFHPEYGDRVAFATINPPPVSYSGDRKSFVGRNRSLVNPAAMDRVGLSGRGGAGFDPCAGLQVMIELAPGERTEITCILGQAASLDEVHRLVLTYRENVATETALGKTKAWWDDLLGTIEVHTPELAADFLINRWLLYQSLNSRMWGRSAFYQSGGAFGFRDQLQDVTAFLHAYPGLAREHILLAASRQFKEGDVQHWWHPPGGVGMRSRISDDLLWLPYTVAQYVRTTGDEDILNVEIPFINAPVLKSDEQETVSTPEVAFERATLFEHCQRAVARGLTMGPHGLPLMGSGDWNDGMNLVGAGGIGESVWLGWFLVDVLQRMAELSDLLGRSALSRIYVHEKNALAQRVEHAAWDGEWYLRAIFDDGTPLGSSASKEARIDSLPQSWAWLGGAADTHRAEVALNAVWRNLVREDERLVLLLAPPFDTSEPSPGYIKGYPPGVRENGGQYTHAAVWCAMALTRKGDGDRATRVLRMLNPIERARDPETVWRYGVEPYVIAADVYQLPGWIGQGGWSWYTGSAAWMYRAWVEEVLGLKVRGNQMELSPVIPGSWDGFHLRYRHGEAIYEIQVENPEKCERGVSWVEMDGQRVLDGVIPLDRNLVKHRILVRMGIPEGTPAATKVKNA
jgi:cyclic beta-1,2-glucan glucanotransferase